MERVRFIEHRGRQILLLDYTNLQDEAEMLEMVQERRDVVSSQPPNSLLTLADIAGARFGRTALARIKEAAVFDRPYVRRAALIGIESTATKGVVESVSIFAARHWKIFPTREEALDWLVSEEEAVDEPAGAHAG